MSYTSILQRGIVLAADIPERDRLVRTIVDCAPFLAACKIGNLALYEHGWGIVREVKVASGLPVIVDLKLMEVPFMAARIVERAAAADADGVMVCGAAGLDTIRFCRATFGGLVVVVTQFTHCRDVISDYDADTIVDASLDLGCDAVQVPATFPDRVRAVRARVGERMQIICCGIGRQGPAIGSAIAAGATHEIIGRAIHDAEGRLPREAAEGAYKTVMETLQRTGP